MAAYNHVILLRLWERVLIKKLVNLVLILLSMAALPLKAADNDSQHVAICKLPDYPPVLAGSMENIIRYHFKYPAEAWKEDKLIGIEAILLIDKEGKVVDVESERPVHPALLAEVKRVMQKTCWYPATYKGYPVNVKYRKVCYLMSSRVSRFPLGLDECAQQAVKILKSWKKTGVVDPTGLEEAKVREAAMMVPEYLPVNFDFIGYLNASGEKDKAILFADSCFKAYHSLYRDPSTFPEFIKDISRERWGYNGRSEIAVALFRAVTHTISGSPVCTNAFEDVLNLINDRIVDGDLIENPSASELRASENRIKHLQQSMVEELTHGEVSFSPSDELWKRIGRPGYSVEEISSSLSYWSERGRVDNAMILQLANLVKAEQDGLLTGNNINKKRINLFGVKALTIWLYKGQDALEEYVAGIVNQTENEKLKRYLITLQNNFKDNEGWLSDREIVLKSLTNLLPDKCNTEDARQLRECRKAIGKVFPVKWLFRC